MYQRDENMMKKLLSSSIISGSPVLKIFQLMANNGLELKCAGCLIEDRHKFAARDNSLDQKF